MQRGRLMGQLIVGRRLGRGILEQAGGQCDGAGWNLQTVILRCARVERLITVR